MQKLHPKLKEAVRELFQMKQKLYNKVTHEWDGYNYIVVSKSKKTKLVSLDEIAREIYGRI